MVATVIAYDSLYGIDAIPSNAQFLLAYIDGSISSGNYAAMRQRFPNATIASITTIGTAGARVADVETGDLTPTSGAQWALNEIKAGRRPTLYFSTGLLANTMVPALAAVGLVIGRDVDWWAANYSAGPNIPTEAIGIQYASTSYDTSLFLASWWGYDPSLPFTLEEQETMVVTPLPNGEVAIYAIGAGSRAGNLLEFIRKPGDQTGNSNTVLDVTYQIGGSDLYNIQG